LSAAAADMSTPSISLQLVVGEAANSAVEKISILSLSGFLMEKTGSYFP
jgi:hypothetical protein